ncbi:hypothetical protein BEH94_01480 [Candidatus Altiarchaeales archaeon WOR_SM1_SCG]|nr:hypothetical protein BEH94_01480 [Candidatus Altiarchaeales archaeon WOR_SM1_SCG]
MIEGINIEFIASRLINIFHETLTPRIFRITAISLSSFEKTGRNRIASVTAKTYLYEIFYSNHYIFKILE